MAAMETRTAMHTECEKWIQCIEWLKKRFEIQWLYGAPGHSMYNHMRTPNSPDVDCRSELPHSNRTNYCWDRLSLNVAAGTPVAFIHSAAIVPDGACAGLGLRRVRRYHRDAGRVLRRRGQRDWHHHDHRVQADTKTIGKSGLMWVIYLASAGTTIITESESVLLFLGAGLIVWAVRTPPWRKSPTAVASSSVLPLAMLPAVKASMNELLTKIAIFFTKAGAWEQHVRRPHFQQVRGPHLECRTCGVFRSAAGHIASVGVAFAKFAENLPHLSCT